MGVLQVYWRVCCRYTSGCVACILVGVLQVYYGVCCSSTSGCIAVVQVGVLHLYWWVCCRYTGWRVASSHGAAAGGHDRWQFQLRHSDVTVAMYVTAPGAVPVSGCQENRSWKLVAGRERERVRACVRACASESA